MNIRFVSVWAIVVALSGCAVDLPIVTQTAAPPSATSTTFGTLPATYTATLVTSTEQAPSYTPKPEPSWTPTAMLTPTIDWSATPTRIGTVTPSIYEVTPSGGYYTPSAGQKMQDVAGEYMPFGALNIRVCAEVSNACSVVGQLSGKVAVQAYGLIIVYPQGDVWVCIDAPPAQYVSSNCDRVVALVIAGKEYGLLVLE